MFQRLRTYLSTKSAGWTMSAPTPELLALFGAAPTASGVAVTAESALRVPAVACAARQISESIATLPITIKRILRGGETEPVPDHPLLPLLNDQWNDWTGAYDGRLALTVDALTRDAGGIAWVNRIDGVPREILRYQPGCIAVQYTEAGEPSYRLSTTDGTRMLDPADVIHVRSFGPDPLSRCPVSLAREAIGLALLMEQHAARLFARGGRPSGTLNVKGKLSKEATERIRLAWDSAHGGSESGKTAVLEESTEWKPISLTSVDAQFHELRQAQVAEIARAFKVPPHLLYELSRATWANSEQHQLEFLAYTLQPWLEVWQGALRRALFSPEERSQYRIEFETDDLTRADIGSRATAYSSLISARIFNPNELRRREGYPPYQGGDEFLNPAITPGAPPSKPKAVA